jgi:hypothetical protein
MQSSGQGIADLHAFFIDPTFAPSQADRLDTTRLVALAP